MSDEFKDLILKMFSYDGKKRPTIEELRNHPWMQVPYNVKETKDSLLDKLSEKRSTKTAESSGDDRNSRGIDQMLELVRQTSVSDLENLKFNDKTDFDIEADPGVLWEELNNFNSDYFDSKMNLECNTEKQYIKATVPGESNDDLVLKIKFFDLKQQNNSEENEDEAEEDEDEPRRLRVRFTKKRGDLFKWYDIFQDMQDTVFDDLLLAPLNHHNAENLTTASDE